MTSHTFTSAVFPSIRGDAHAGAEDAARARGYAKGYAEGLRAAETELAAERLHRENEFTALTASVEDRTAQQSNTVDRVLEALNIRFEPTVESAADCLAQSSFELAESVIGVELSDIERSARSIVSRICNTIEAVTETTVRVSPEMCDLVTAALGTRPGLTVIGDSGLEPGDAIAEVAHGYLDAQIRTALARAKAELLGDD